MLKHFLIAPIESWFVTVGTRHAALEIVRDNQLWNAAKKLEGSDVRADPIVELLRVSGFGVGVVGRAEHGDEDLRLLDFTRQRIDDGNCWSGVINEHLLAGAMGLAH